MNLFSLTNTNEEQKPSDQEHDSLESFATSTNAVTQENFQLSPLAPESTTEEKSTSGLIGSNMTLASLSGGVEEFNMYVYGGKDWATRIINNHDAKESAAASTKADKDYTSFSTPLPQETQDYLGIVQPVIKDWGKNVGQWLKDGNETSKAIVNDQFKQLFRQRFFEALESVTLPDGSKYTKEQIDEILSSDKLRDDLMKAIESTHKKIKSGEIDKHPTADYIDLRPTYLYYYPDEAQAHQDGKGYVMSDDVKDLIASTKRSNALLELTELEKSTLASELKFNQMYTSVSEESESTPAQNENTPKLIYYKIGNGESNKDFTTYVGGKTEIPCFDFVHEPSMGQPKQKMVVLKSRQRDGKALDAFLLQIDPNITSSSDEQVLQSQIRDEGLKVLIETYGDQNAGYVRKFEPDPYAKDKNKVLTYEAAGGRASLSRTQEKKKARTKYKKPKVKASPLLTKLIGGVK